MLRVYALYERSKKVIVFFGLVACPTLALAMVRHQPYHFVKDSNLPKWVTLSKAEHQIAQTLPVVAAPGCNPVIDNIS